MTRSRNSERSLTELPPTLLGHSVCRGGLATFLNELDFALPTQQKGKTAVDVDL